MTRISDSRSALRLSLFAGLSCAGAAFWPAAAAAPFAAARIYLAAKLFLSHGITG
jgi:hypothetical protein